MSVMKMMAVIWQEVNKALCKAGVRSGKKHKDKEDEGELTEQTASWGM